MVAHRLVESIAPAINVADVFTRLSGSEDGAVLADHFVIVEVDLFAGMLLSREGHRDGAIGDNGAGVVGHALGQPDILGLGVLDTNLVPENVDHGADTAEGEAAITTPSAIGVPGGADPVVLEEVVETEPGIGAEDTIGLENEEPLGGLEDRFVEPQGREETRNHLLASRAHVGGDVGEIELAGVDLFADGHGLVDVLNRLWGAHEAESPIGGNDGHEMQHQRGEDRVWSVFNEEGDLGLVES